MFLEYCEDGDLKQYIENKNGLSEAEALQIMQHIIEAFKTICAAHIIHSDIKPTNILLSNSIAKVSDFGFSKRVY